MNQALLTAWATALAIAVPILVLFWWARRHAPASNEPIDYTVGRHAAPPAEPNGHTTAAAPHATADAPVPANPAALAPSTEPAVAPATIVALPASAPLPPEPPSVVPTAPVAPAAPEQHATTAGTPSPAAVPDVAPVPVAAVATAPAAPTKVKETAPEPPAPVAEAVAIPAPQPVEPPAAVTEPQPAMVAASESVAQATEPAAAPASAPAAPAGEPDDFNRLYGLDATAIAALQAAGIHTYRELAAASIPNLRQILTDAGQPNTDPGTWPQQARFAAGGKWKQLDSRFRPKA